MAVLSIDLGTTGCKAGLFQEGETLGLAYRHLAWTSPREGWAEQDAEEAWSLVREVAREAVAAPGAPTAVEAIALSVQGDAIVPIDRSGRALHPAILGMDTRSAGEARDLEEAFGRRQLHAWTGMPCEPLNAITKIWWLRRNRPGILRDTWKYVHYGEFLLMKLCETPALDFTMASRTMAFDPVARAWVPEVLEAVGVSPEDLGVPCPSGTPVGEVSRPVATELGIRPGAIVVPGGHDQCMAAIGAGVIEPGVACYSMGTAEVISTCFPRPMKTAAMLESNYPCYRHAVDGQYFTITLNQSGGLSLEWLQGLWAEGRPLSDSERDAAYATALSGLEISPSSAVFLPHLVGSGTPTCDHRSRAAFFGLALKTSRGTMFQAAVEALAFEARLNLGLLHAQGIEVRELRAVGGGTRSRKALELKATVLRRPFRTLSGSEAALLGAALLAETAIGRHRDIASACARGVRLGDLIEPVASAAQAYDSAFERYRRACAALWEFHHEGKEPCPAPYRSSTA